MQLTYFSCLTVLHQTTLLINGETFILLFLQDLAWTSTETMTETH